MKYADLRDFLAQLENRGELKRIRAEVRREGERFLRRMNRLLARYDRDRNPKAPGGEPHYAGLGLYFFDEKPAADRGSGARASEAARTGKERHR